jgi:hypothetical protein
MMMVATVIVTISMLIMYDNDDSDNGYDDDLDDV